MGMSISAILPEKTIGSTLKPTPVLYLLHGLSNDHTSLLRKTRLECYLKDTDITVIMPCVHRSWYTNMCHGGQYWTFISEEVPWIARQFLNISTRREDTFAAGISMGGYGAFKLALRRPELFAGAASLSGSLDILTHARRGDAEWRKMFETTFGSAKDLQSSDDNLLVLLEKVSSEKDKLPNLYQVCGTEDFLYRDNVTFHEKAKSLGIQVEYVEDKGIHDWEFWNLHIQEVIRWIQKQIQ